MSSDLPTLELRLAEAKHAKHQLLTGKHRVQVMYALGGNHSVTFQQVDMAKLDAYIVELTDAVAAAKGSGGRTAFHWS